MGKSLRLTTLLENAHSTRHWPVVWSGTIVMLIFWGITPFQNAMIGMEILQQKRQVAFSQTSELLPVGEQHEALTAEFYYTAYNIAVLKTQPPPFLTSEAAYHAARPEKYVPNARQSWIFPSEEYSAKFECVQGVQDSTTASDRRVTFVDGQGCSCIFQPFLSSGESQALVSINEIEELDTQGAWNMTSGALLTGNCTIGNTKKMALISSKQLSESANRTTTCLFCSPRYMVRSANLTTSPHGAILSATHNNAAHDIPPGRLNLSHIEIFLTTVLSRRDSSLRHAVSNKFPSIRMPQSNTCPRKLLTAGVLPTYACALSPADRTEYLNASVLQQTMEAAYNLLFISAVHSLSEVSKENKITDGAVVVEQEAVVIVQSFAALLEAFLCVIFLLGTVLLHIYRRRITNLRGDPSSLASTMSLIAESESLLLLSCTSATQGSIQWMGDSLLVHRFHLKRRLFGAHHILDMGILDRTISDHPIDVLWQTSPSPRSSNRHWKNSIESSIRLGCLYCAFISILIGLSIWSWKYASTYQGEQHV